MYEILTQLLSIPNYKVVGVEMADDTITLDIESTPRVREGRLRWSQMSSLWYLLHRLTREPPAHCARLTHQRESLLSPLYPTSLLLFPL